MKRVAFVLLILLGGLMPLLVGAEDPPALNPFGTATPRKDAVPGRCELSDGRVLTGHVYLTRDLRLKIYDEALERQREVPLSALREIACVVDKEWMEKEWRFKENANDQKVFTGRSYPVRESRHQLTLHDGRTITGPLSAIVYIAPDEGGPPQRFLLHKRHKGDPGTKLPDLVYVRRITLGDSNSQPATPRPSQ